MIMGWINQWEAACNQENQMLLHNDNNLVNLTGLVQV